MYDNTSIQNCTFAYYLHGCHNEYSAVMDAHSLRVFEHRVLKVCGPKWEEVAGGMRKLHNEEICNLCSSLNTRMLRSRRMRWV
jgi:hypothetical protein